MSNEKGDFVSQGPQYPSCDKSPTGEAFSGIGREVVVRDPQGMHMRPAAMFAKVARQFKSQIQICKEGRSVNGKSQLDLLLLAAEHGSKLKIEANGEDAAEALDALAGIFDVADWDEFEQAKVSLPSS